MSQIRPENTDRAFPHLDEWGLSKREYFAAHAPDSVVKNCGTIGMECARLGIDPALYDPAIHFPIICARNAVAYADALIAALNEKKND